MSGPSWSWRALRTATFPRPLARTASSSTTKEAAAALTSSIASAAPGTFEVTADDPTLNPYWPRQGATAFVDPDGYRLIVVSTLG